MPTTVHVTEMCRFWNRRTAVVLLNRTLENVIRTLMPYMYNTRSTGVAFYENGHTVSIITVRAVGTGATYLIVLAHEFDAG